MASISPSYRISGLHPCLGTAATSYSDTRNLAVVVAGVRDVASVWLIRWELHVRLVYVALLRVWPHLAVLCMDHQTAQP